MSKTYKDPIVETVTMLGKFKRPMPRNNVLSQSNQEIMDSPMSSSREASSFFASPSKGGGIVNINQPIISSNTSALGNPQVLSEKGHERKWNLFDSRSRQQRVNVKCTSQAHPPKTNLMNQFNVKKKDYRDRFVLHRTKSSMEKNHALVIQKTMNNEIPHPCSLLSTKYVNYLED